MKHKNVRKVGYGAALQVVSAVVGVMSFFKQQQAADDAQAAQERQRQIQARINEKNAQRQRVAARREERITSGKMLASTVTSGVVAGGTSPFVGGQGSLTSQLGSNISNINTNLTSSNAMGDAMTDYYNATGNMQQWQSIGSAAGTVFANAGAFESGFNKLKTWATG